jgi:hypothetical protein
MDVAEMIELSESLVRTLMVSLCWMLLMGTAICIPIGVIETISFIRTGDWSNTIVMGAASAYAVGLVVWSLVNFRKWANRSRP